MTTKLTLTIDDSIIAKAKLYAKKKGRSLSDIIENYLKVVTNEEPIRDIDSTKLVKSLKGSFNLDDDSDYKDQLTTELEKKYLQ